MPVLDGWCPATFDASLLQHAWADLVSRQFPHSLPNHLICSFRSAGPRKHQKAAGNCPQKVELPTPLLDSSRLFPENKKNKTLMAPTQPPILIL